MDEADSKCQHTVFCCNLRCEGKILLFLFRL